MHRCRRVRIFVLIAFLQQLAPIAPVPAQELRRMRVAVTSPGMTNLSLYIADRRGFFKEQQIFNEIIVMRSAARQIQALVAGSIELSAQAPDPLIRAVERGADLTMLSGLANSAAYDLVADKNFSRSKSCVARPWAYPELIHRAHSCCRRCSAHMA